MKRSALLRHLRRHGCVLKREGSRHSLWMNPGTGNLNRKDFRRAAVNLSR